MRLRVWEPEPQVLLHVDQLLKADTVQWMGQEPSSQDCETARAEHATPPFAAGVVTVLVRVWVPEAHVLEQADHADHLDTVQSTGQALVWQACVCDKLGQALPPYAESTFAARVRN